MSVLAIGTVSGSLAAFGLHSHHLRLLAGAPSKLSAIAPLLSGRVVLVFLVTLPVAAIATALLAAGASGMFLILFVATASQASQAMLVPVLAEGRYGRVAWVNLADKGTFGLALGAAALTQQVGDVALITSFGLGNLIGALVSATSWASPSTLARMLTSTRLPRPWALESVWLGASSGSFAAQGLDVPLARAVDTQVAGQYAAVSRWNAPIVLLSAAAATVVLRDAPRSTDDRAAIVSAARLVKWPLALVCLLSLAGSMAAYMFTDSILGQAYDDSRMGAVVLIAAAPLNFLNQVLYNLLIGRKRDRWAGTVSIAVVTLQLIVLVPGLTYLVGSPGPAYALALTQLALFVGYSAGVLQFSGKGEA